MEPQDDRDRSPIPENSVEETLSVLVVEDNPGDLALVQRMLRSVSAVRLELSSASSLSEALKQLRFGADIVLLDLNLPDSRGLDTLQTIHQQHPAIPIIVLTGYDDHQQAVEALLKGAKDYLIKGLVEGHILGRAILRNVERRSSLREKKSA